ncbi:hypothetical protein Goarm_004919, partial [Gossypium armourianum]|nr:hypothetical protein [Gossypium armourianum]
SIGRTLVVSIDWTRVSVEIPGQNYLAHWSAFYR